MMTARSTSPQEKYTSLAALVITTLLLTFGAVLLLFGILYVKDMQTLSDLPNALWSFICGIPVESGVTLPLLIMLALLAFAGAGLAWGWQRISRARMVLAFVTLAAILLLFGLVVFRALEAAADTSSSTQDVTSTTGAIHYLSAPRLLSDFTLTDNENKPLSLSDLEGRYTLLFFGYLHCPDFCPTTLARMRQVYTALGEDADRLNILFISVDGERDTPEALDAYLSRFDPAFIGMRGERTVLAQITPDYALSYSLGDPDENGDYSVSHSVQTYLIDPERRLHAIIDYGTPAADIVEALRALWSSS